MAAGDPREDDAAGKSGRTRHGHEQIVMELRPWPASRIVSG